MRSSEPCEPRFMCPREPTLSVISNSLRDEPLDVLSSILPDEVRGIDLTILREVDVGEIDSYFRKNLSRGAPGDLKRIRTEAANQAEFIANLSDRHLEWTARYFDEAIARANSELIPPRQGDICVTALSTFFPDISRTGPGSQAIQGAAVRALRNSLKLATHLKRLGGHPCSCVEAVCGSWVETHPTRSGSNAKASADSNDETCTISFSTKDTKFDCLIRAVADAIEGAGEDCEACVALEIEPGPFYLLNNAPSVELFLDKLEKTKNLQMATKDRIQLNLDIGHALVIDKAVQGSLWSVLHKDRSQRKIVHAHISDHVDWHCVDLAPGAKVSVGPESMYRDWLDFYLGLSRNTFHTGAIALEMEAASSIVALLTGLRRTSYLLGLTR